MRRTSPRETARFKFPFDPHSSLNQKLVDGFIAALSFCAALEAFYEGRVPAAAAQPMWILIPVLVLGQITVNTALGAYRSIWKYFGLRDAIARSRNHAIFASGLLLLRYVTPPPLTFLRIPAAVIVTQCLLSLLGALTARAARRLQYERSGRTLRTKRAPAVLLIGAGRVGAKTVSDIRPLLNLRPLGFLDDDPKKAGSVVSGLPVLGLVSSLVPVIQKYGVSQVIVCIARPPREMLRRIWGACELLDLPVKMVPSLENVLRGKATRASFRDVEMNDLLGRTPILGPASEAELAAYRGKRILVTGAGGSIGSELVSQLSKVAPSHLLLLDKDENGLNDTYLRVANVCKATPLIADIRFADRSRNIFETFKPEVVFHAAAQKHVHLMEANACEAITNNVTGTRNLVEQALAFGASRFVQVSTDKAVNPTSVMGASKRLCEMIVQSQRHDHETLFCCVRFGNVLGSRGSVVPIFQEQIARGGPVTVTHPDAKRYLMTIPEAVGLLIEAGTLAGGGKIFVLDMGEPVLIRHLARDLIELSGLSPTRDIRVEITGLKPGEKLNAQLLDHDTEALEPARLPKIHTISTLDFDTATFARKLRALETAAWDDDGADVHCKLADFGIGFVYDAPARLWPVNARPLTSASAGTPLASGVRISHSRAQPGTAND
jgi:FlaA1/EpsC-like NDP-sugar epimerase